MLDQVDQFFPAVSQDGRTNKVGQGGCPQVDTHRDFVSTAHHAEGTWGSGDTASGQHKVWRFDGKFPQPERQPGPLFFEINHIANRLADLVFKKGGNRVSQGGHNRCLQGADQHGDEEGQGDRGEEGETKQDVEGEADQDRLALVLLDESLDVANREIEGECHAKDEQHSQQG